MREVNQHNYLQIVPLIIDTPMYMHNPYVIQIKCWNTLFNMLAHVRKYQWMIVNLLKYIQHNKYEMILRKENELNNQKCICDQLYTLCVVSSMLNGFL